MDELFVGGKLIAWDTTTGAELWRFAERKIDPAKLAVTGGRVYLYANRRYAACLDLNSGKQLWKTEAPIAEPKGPGMGWIDGHATVKNMSIHRQGAVVTNDVYLINYLPHRQCQAFSTTDGHLLWDRMRGPVGENPKQASLAAGKNVFGYNVVLDDIIVERKQWQRPSDVFALRTAEPIVPGTRFAYAGCGRFTGVASGLLLGQCGEIYDIKANRTVVAYNAKSSCGTGQFVADGLLFKVAANCSGCSEWRGSFTSRSTPKYAVRSGPRLETGAADSGKEIASDPRDWPTFRSDVTRKGSSPAVVPSDVVIRWIYAPVRAEQSVLGADGGYLERDVNAAPAVAVGDRIWIGTAEGAVVCVDRKTGSEAWRYWTAGRIMGSPTWWRGQDIGILPGGWVALGGRQFNLPLNSAAQPRNNAVFLQAALDGAVQNGGGYPNLLELPAAHQIDSIPVWDSTEVLLSGKPAAWQTLPDDFNLKSRNFLTPVLAANAVVFISGRTGDFQVVAVNRTDRHLLWDVKLPAQPVFGGLSLTRHGDVLAPLVDGRIVCGSRE